MTDLTSKFSFLRKGLIAMGASLLAPTAIFAVPARPTPITFTQPDGQTVTVMLRGDENAHYYLSEDDYLLVNIDDALFYGSIDASGMISSTGVMASAPERRSQAEKSLLRTVDKSKTLSRLNDISAKRRGIRSIKPLAMSRAADDAVSQHPAIVPGTYFPTLGDQKALVILVEYEDVKFNLDDPYDYFHRMLTQEGFSDYGGTGCVAEYFRENSLGQFNLQADVVGPVTLPLTRSYYGRNDMWGSDDKPHMMAVDACDILDDTVDFSQYDRDGDGKIDNVFIFYAGEGEASGGPAESVWPHSWMVTAGSSKKYYYDGVLLDHYACTNEWYSNRPDGMGTFVHEFSHVMGLPDLYSTSTTTAFTPDSYDVLDYGPYNNDGRTPPYYSVFERYAFGWLQPKVIDSPADITLHDITTNEGYIIETRNKEEYYMIENRQKSGWDKYIPGHGMIIWHIDYDHSEWVSNTVNDDPSHQRVDLVEADNKRTTSSRSGDTFPGTDKVTSFTDDTTPSMVTWANESLDMPITDIAESAGVITFKVRGGIVDITPVAVSQTGTPTAGTFDITWDKVGNATCYLVSVFSDAGAIVGDWQRKNVGNVDRVTIDGLEPESQYTCIVWASNGYSLSPESNIVAVTTGIATLDFKYPVAREATNVNGDSFTANWEAMPDASAYKLTVYTKGEPIIHSDYNGFKNGTVMPDGWQTNATQTSYNKAYCGQALPSLRLGSDRAFVLTPDYDNDLTVLSFWTRGSSATVGNTLNVYAKVNGVYTQIAELKVQDEATPGSAAVLNKEGATVVIDPLPAGTRSVKIEYVETVEHKGYVAIDDVTVEWGRDYPKYPIEGYDGLDVGASLSYAVQGLLPTTTYYYTVVATDGTLTSRLSNEVEVTTTDPTGITDIEAAASVHVAGSTVYISGMPGQAVTMHDVLGRQVAAAVIGPDGSATMHRPDTGVYIVRTANTAVKIK